MNDIMSLPTLPVTFNDPVNAAILAVSEDRLQGFQRDPIGISEVNGIAAFIYSSFNGNGFISFELDP